MKQIQWFDRKFDFPEKQNIFPSLLERLKGTSILLDYKLSNIKEVNLRTEVDEEWSILENLGHLIDLEPLWLGRLHDILNREEMMRPVDLGNKKTDLANHNIRNTKELLQEFSEKRNNLVQELERLTENEVFWYSLHPRLKTPMRIMDLFLFVAEHDDHHLARITEINTLLAND